jgi:hypothetical protein
MNGDSLNNVRYNSSGHFRNKRWEYLKNKIKSLKQTVRATTLKIYRGINKIKT